MNELYSPKIINSVKSGLTIFEKLNGGFSACPQTAVESHLILQKSTGRYMLGREGEGHIASYLGSPSVT